MTKDKQVEQLLERSSKDIIGLIPKRLFDQLIYMGFYKIEPLDAYPFKLRVFHKFGIEAVIEGADEKELLNDASSLVSLWGPELKLFDEYVNKKNG
jgi:hypothetical protein